MAKSQKAYFGLSRLISVILAIIPPTAWVCGIITCLQEGRILPAIIRIFFGWNIVWLLDLVWVLLYGNICHIWILI